MRKILIGFVVVAVIAVAAYFRFHHAKPPVEAAYAANREVTVWSTTAQVRSPVATANFGEPLGIMSRYGDQVQVRTATGIVGWVSEHDLLSAEFWQKAKDLDSTASALPNITGAALLNEWDMCAMLPKANGTFAFLGMPSVPWLLSM